MRDASLPHRMAGAMLLLVCVLAPAAPAADEGMVFLSVRYRGDDGGGNSDGATYRNPVISGFHPDPSMVRVGDDFYLVTSSFGYFPGLPVFHSRDLVAWTQIGNAIDRPAQIDYGHNEELTRGLFAPAISHRSGRYYIANTCFYCDGGNYVIHADDPAGPWSDPVWLGFSGIDPSIFFDRDGRAWIVNNDVPQVPMRYDGHRAIWLQQFDAENLRMVGPRTVLVDAGADPASRPEHVEGPHLFRRGDWVYLTAAEGGTGEQHAQMVWRSRTVTGPYQPFEGNPILTQRDLDPARSRPVTSAGHAQLVELADGRWWAVFLATRPYRGNQYNLGRETFLLPVTWEDDWPRILARGEPVPLRAPRPALARQPRGPRVVSGAFEWEERFDGDALPPQWMTLHPPAHRWFSTGGEGLRLVPSSLPLGAFGKRAGQPSYLAHRLQHHHATIELTLAPWRAQRGELAGIALLQNERHHYIAGVQRDRRGLALVLYRRAGADDPETGQRLARLPLPPLKAPLTLRLRLADARLDIDYARQAGRWRPLAHGLDSSTLSVERAGGFIGNTFGPYALRRTAEAAAD